MNDLPKPAAKRKAPFDLHAFARATVLRGIWSATCPADMKNRIMLARQCGFLTDAETDEWLSARGLEEA